ncbi:MAG: hypothetical protein HYR84_16250 [Planctomycetes bacterium]|nr:hypothetical protein [Planctomycetota bacterium]
MDRDKRRTRKLKREVKKAGNKKRRHSLKRDLRDNPAEAHWSEPSVGKASSESLNGLDQDATRKRPDSEPEA